MTTVFQSKRRERLFRCAQMDEPVFGAPEISLQIRWNHL
jgi:hypothetical protein